MSLCVAMRLGQGCMGAAFVCGVTRSGPGCVVVARFNGPDMVGRGELQH